MFGALKLQLRVEKDGFTFIDDHTHLSWVDLVEKKI